MLQFTDTWTGRLIVSTDRDNTLFCLIPAYRVPEELKWALCIQLAAYMSVINIADISSPPIRPHHGRAQQLTLVTSAGKDCVQGRSADLPGTAW